MLELQGVTAGYGDVVVLRDLSLTVPTSSVVALLGPNGAGKSTTMKVAAGALRARAGRVLLDGDDVTKEDDFLLARRGLRYVPEGRSIFASMTVRENLMLFIGSADASAALDRATEAFPVLGQRMSQTAGSLSGGEQQMLALARFYASGGDVLLVDEVSLGLAPKIVDEIYGFLATVAAEGVALLLVEQYVERALDLADYVYLLDRGRIAFAGEPGELDAATIYERYVGMAS
jgi:branched-chain amino acid transport system ATP-binding protein